MKKKPIEIKMVNWGELPKEETEKEVATKRKITFSPTSWGELSQAEQEDNGVKIPGPIKFEPNPWDEISGLQEPEIIRAFDGVNELDSFSIRDEHATRTSNMTSAKYPSLASRNGNTAVSWSEVASTQFGLGVYSNTTEDELHVITYDNWVKVKELTPGVYSRTVLQTGLVTQERYTFTQFQGNFSKAHLIASNGNGAPFKYDGVSTLSALGGAPAGLDYICNHDNRVYGAVRQTLYFSALRKAEDWSTVNDSGSIVVESNDGKVITGLTAGSGRLTIFKRNSVHELYGTNPSNFQLKTVTDSVGTPTGHSVQVIDGVIFFLGNDGVYQYSGGSLPVSEFSLPVKETLAKINKSAANKSASWTVGRKYYLAIPVGNGVASNNTVLEYDLDYNTWNVWPLAVKVKGVEWNGATWIGQPSNLRKMDSAQTEDTAGTPLAFEWVSKAFSISSLAAKARWYRLWLTASIPLGATLNVYLSSDKTAENWTLVKSVTGVTEPMSVQEIRIPTSAVFQSNWVRVRLEGTGQVVVYELARQERVYPMGM